MQTRYAIIFYHPHKGVWETYINRLFALESAAEAYAIAYVKVPYKIAKVAFD